MANKNKTMLSGDTDPFQMFKAQVRSRLVVEYKYYALVNVLD